MLVVIGIIGVLLALLGPGLGRAKGMARGIKCRAQQRYPLFDQVNEGQVLFWTDLLGSYLAQPVAGKQTASAPGTVYRCPAQGRPAAAGAEHISYGYNGIGYAEQGLGGRTGLGQGQYGIEAVRESEVAVPADMIAMGDGIQLVAGRALFLGGLSLSRWQRLPIELGAGQLPPPAELARYDAQARRLHAGRAMIGCCDGHVESDRLPRLFEEKSGEALRRWNRDHEAHGDWLR
jgi:prepilin-type processing-associated H-X9-DG protein